MRQGRAECEIEDDGDAPLQKPLEVAKTNDDDAPLQNHLGLQQPLTPMPKMTLTLTLTLRSPPLGMALTLRLLGMTFTLRPRLTPSVNLKTFRLQ